MWTAGSVWIAPLEGTRWRPYGESTDSQESRLGLVASMAMPGREQWLRKSAPKGGVEAIRGEGRWFRSPRHAWSGRAKAHHGFDIPRVRSGAVKGDLQLGCSEPFHDHHRTSAVRTAPCRLTSLRLRHGNFGNGEQLTAQRQRCRALAIGQEAEAADAHEASRQEMLQEAPQELVGVERHDALLTRVRVIFPAERDLSLGEVDYAVIGNRHPMRVACQILQHVCGSAEGRLRVHHPLVAMQRAHKGSKRLLLFQCFECTGQTEPLFAPEAFQPIGKL